MMDGALWRVLDDSEFPLLAIYLRNITSELTNTQFSSLFGSTNYFPTHLYPLCFAFNLIGMYVFISSGLDVCLKTSHLLFIQKCNHIIF